MTPSALPENGVAPNLHSAYNTAGIPGNYPGQARKNRGFTLIEIMVASVMGLFIIAVSLTFLNQAAHMADIMDTRMRINSQARDFIRLVSGGGGNLNGVRLAGLHGNSEVSSAVPGTIDLAPSGNTLSRNGQQYQLAGTDIGIGNNGASNFSTDQASVDIACTAATIPHQDCLNAGTLAVTGYLDGDPEILATAPAIPRHCAAGNRNTIASVKWRLIDPFRLQRANAFIAEETSAEFTTMVALLVDCQP